MALKRYIQIFSNLKPKWEANSNSRGEQNTFIKVKTGLWQIQNYDSLLPTAERNALAKIQKELLLNVINSKSLYLDLTSAICAQK